MAREEEATVPEEGRERIQHFQSASSLMLGTEPVTPRPRTCVETIVHLSPDSLRDQRPPPVAVMEAWVVMAERTVVVNGPTEAGDDCSLRAMHP